MLHGTAGTAAAGSVNANVRRGFTAISVRGIVHSRGSLRRSIQQTLLRKEGEGEEFLLSMKRAILTVKNPADKTAAVKLDPESSYPFGVDPIIVHSFNVSCQCDPLDTTADMVGMVLYNYRGATEWELNGIRCKAGYIVIKLADNLAGVASKVGQVHGKLYRSVFGQDPDQDVIATGFAIRRGSWQFSSRTFNANYRQCLVSEEEQQLIKAAVENRFRPGATHRDKIFHIPSIKNKIVILPLPKDQDLGFTLDCDDHGLVGVREDLLDGLFDLKLGMIST